LKSQSSPWVPHLRWFTLKEARALLSDPEITVEEVAARLGVSSSTLYRHLPGGRGAVVGTTADPA
jgi:DNA-binding transcriptional ArsR family regulator